MKFTVISALIVMGFRKDEAARDPKADSQPKVNEKAQNAGVVGGASQRKIQRESPGTLEGRKQLYTRNSKLKLKLASWLLKNGRDPLELEGKGSAALDRFPRGRDYVSMAQRVVVRIFGNNKITACNEQVVVKFLDGLDGQV